MNWFIAALLSAALYAASNAISRGFQPKLGVLTGLLFFISGALVAVALGFLFTKGALVKYVGAANTKALLGMATSGFVWAWGTFLLFQLFAKNIALSVVLPISIGGIGVGGVIAGLLFFGETVTLLQMGAIMLILIGAIILGRG